MPQRKEAQQIASLKAELREEQLTSKVLKIQNDLLQRRYETNVAVLGLVKEKLQSLEDRQRSGTDRVGEGMVDHGEQMDGFSKDLDVALKGFGRSMDIPTKLCALPTAN